MYGIYFVFLLSTNEIFSIDTEIALNTSLLKMLISSNISNFIRFL